MQDGLFVGMLDDLMIAKRHRGRVMENIYSVTGDFEKRLSDFQHTDAMFNLKSAEFILKFGDRLTLKE